MRKRNIASPGTRSRWNIPYMRVLSKERKRRQGLKRALPRTRWLPAPATPDAGVAVVPGPAAALAARSQAGLSGRGYTVLARTSTRRRRSERPSRWAGFLRSVDVRDPTPIARRAGGGERGPAEVWVKQRRGAAHAQVMGALRRGGAPAGRGQRAGRDLGSRAAIEAMRGAVGRTCTDQPGLAVAWRRCRPGRVCAATKHAGWASAIAAGRLRAAGIPITVHAVCPDGADTDMTRERADETRSASSGPRRGCSRGRSLGRGDRAARFPAARVGDPTLARLAARSTALAGRNAVAAPGGASQAR